jgi:hypothetical protein
MAGRVEAGALVEELRDQVKFLRSQLEARDRDAAELRAALRAALQISQRALPESRGARREESAQGVQSGPVEEKNASNAKGAQRPAQREARPLWKVVLGIR